MHRAVSRRPFASTPSRRFTTRLADSESLGSHDAAPARARLADGDPRGGHDERRRDPQLRRLGRPRRYQVDVERARRDTPAASQILHFNNAGAALMPTPVLQAQLRHLELEAETGGYEAAAAAGDRIEAIYDSIARLVNADRAEIALVENATVAWDMAFYSVGFAAGDRILTAEAEYLSNRIAFLQVARRSGAVVDLRRFAELRDVRQHGACGRLPEHWLWPDFRCGLRAGR